MSKSFLRGILTTGTIACCWATSAVAAVDMSGAWFLRAYQPTVDYEFRCHLAVTQDGSYLTVQGIGCYIGDFFGVGTVDPETGAFSAWAPAWGDCTNGLSVTGTTNAASSEFVGTFDCETSGSPFQGTINGSRCGNGVFDPGEA